jgi:hypothetical protein
MRSVLLRLFAALAVLLMPFGMAAAPAEPIHYQQMAMAAPMPTQHCPESAPGSNGALAHCAMACSAALPAINSVEPFAYPVVRSSPQVPALKTLSGVEPEIATPPPRFA